MEITLNNFKINEKKNKIFCFIPARSGSSRVKNKNIRLIKNRPLIYWTVSKAIKSKKFDKIIFSSDSEKYYKLLIKFLQKDSYDCSYLIFDKRDKNHSNTKSKIFDYIKFDLIKKFNLKKDDLLVQLLPTCPLRSIKSIKKVINYSMANKVNAFSVCEYDFHIKFGLSLKNNSWRPIFKNSPLITGNTQSQSQKLFYHPNGLINCLFARTLNNDSKSIYDKAKAVIVPKVESFDVDTEEDIKILKKLF